MENRHNSQTSKCKFSSLSGGKTEIILLSKKISISVIDNLLIDRFEFKMHNSNRLQYFGRLEIEQNWCFLLISTNYQIFGANWNIWSYNNLLWMLPRILKLNNRKTQLYIIEIFIYCGRSSVSDSSFFIYWDRIFNISVCLFVCCPEKS